MIRAATTADLPELVRMGLRFGAAAPGATAGEVDPDDVARGFEGLLENGVVLVAERAGRLVGLIAGIISAPWFAPSRQAAVELLWWVDAEARGGTAGVRLAQAFESWAVERGARIVCLSDLVIDGATPAGAVIKRMGYRLAERTHVKEL